jgi:hypothetical protein
MDVVAPAGLEGLVVRPTSGEPGLRYGLWLTRRSGPGTPATEAFWSVAGRVLGSGGISSADGVIVDRCWPSVRAPG